MNGVVSRLGKKESKKAEAGASEGFSQSTNGKKRKLKEVEGLNGGSHSGKKARAASAKEDTTMKAVASPKKVTAAVVKGKRTSSQKCTAKVGYSHRPLHRKKVLRERLLTPESG